MAELKTIYGLTASIGTAYATNTWTYASLGDGIDNVSESLNEVVGQYFFMADGGFATNHVTGLAPTFTLTGRRIVGDTAQDYIFSKKYSLGDNRKSSFKLEWIDGQATPKKQTLTVDCTICNIQEWSGASTDDSAISFEIRFDGAPTITESAVS